MNSRDAPPNPLSITVLISLDSIGALALSMPCGRRRATRTMAGYSGTPLIKKLGIKPGYCVGFLNSPDGYTDLLGPLPQGVRVVLPARGSLDFIHLFSTDRAELARKLPELKQKIVENGMIWVSWPKKTSRVPSTITEDAIRKIALPLGLVDIKVCAVDEVWSGLKLVIRREERKSLSENCVQRRF